MYTQYFSLCPDSRLLLCSGVWVEWRQEEALRHSDQGAGVQAGLSREVPLWVTGYKLTAGPSGSWASHTGRHFLFFAFSSLPIPSSQAFLKTKSLTELLEPKGRSVFSVCRSWESSWPWENYVRQIVSPAGTYFAIGAKGSHSIYLSLPELEAIGSQVLLLKESFSSSPEKGKNFPLTWDKVPDNALGFVHSSSTLHGGQHRKSWSPGRRRWRRSSCADSAFGRFMEDGRQGTLLGFGLLAGSGWSLLQPADWLGPRLSWGHLETPQAL